MISNATNLTRLLSINNISLAFTIPSIRVDETLTTLLEQIYLDFTLARITDETAKKLKNNFLFDEQLNYLVREWEAVFEETVEDG
jgi:hypothetical protein